MIEDPGLLKSPAICGGLSLCVQHYKLKDCSCLTSTTHCYITGGEEDGEGAPTGEDGNEASQRRKKHKSVSNTQCCIVLYCSEPVFCLLLQSSLSTAVVVERNPKVLDMNTNSLEFAVDPLFKKTSAAFDEGGADGLLFSQLFVRYIGFG